MKELTILMVVLLSIFIYTTYVRKSIYLTKVHSSVNDRSYLVRKMPDQKEAADKLAHLTMKLQRLCDHCKSNVSSDKEDKEDKEDKTDRKKSVERLVRRFNPDKIIEHMPGNTYVSHTVDKGRELSMCVRDKETNTFIPDNDVTFVAIHELAHVMSASTGHTEEFWDNMRYLLEQGSEIGIYSPVDYSKEPVDFCGMQIDSSPLFVKN